MATDNKYDRQLRLWGAKGQKALSECHVVLINPSAAGTESLKNLVLPGVGRFTVVDEVNSIVTAQDASSNFFLPTSDIGRPRAETASKFLAELNPDVRACHTTIDNDGNGGGGWPTTEQTWTNVLTKIQNDESTTATSTTSTTDPSSKILVLASDLSPQTLLPLADACYTQGYPMLAVTSYGLIGSVRLQVPGAGISILEPKRPNTKPDLRLMKPIGGLVEMTSQPPFQDLSQLDSQQHGHVPYPIILLKAMEQWKAQSNNNGKNVPKTFPEKEEFKSLVKGMSRDFDKELNFQEAYNNAYLAYTELDLNIPPKGMDVDDDGAADNVGDTAMSTLRKLYDTLETFMDRHGRCPLNGSIPDMTASTEWYVKLQRMYKQQAEADVEEMKQLLDGTGISEDDITSFCANVFSVSHLETRSLKAEYRGIAVVDDNNGTNRTEEESELVDDWKMALMDPYEDAPIHTPIVWYLGLRACQNFNQHHGYFPGCGPQTTDWKDDIPHLEKIFTDEILPAYGLADDDLLTNKENIHNVCHEFTRYSNAEIHNIASVVGGVASQEAVKLITSQYIPLDNTYIYNGIVSVGGVYRM